jgi:HD-like signal output (HDOD) protein
MIATPIPRETLLHVVKTLPAAPHILSQLGHLLLDPNSDMDEVIKLLRCDTALTARIIRISNSAFYSTGHRNASIDEALARVGFNEVYRLTGLAAVAQISDHDLPTYGITGAQLRENSLLTALIAEIMAEFTNVNPRHAYTAGLLRSIGKIAIDRLACTGSYSGSYANHANLPLAEWETAFMGLNNCDAAAVILSEWRFPAMTVTAIHQHYLLSPSQSDLALLLNLASGAADRGGHPLPGEARYWGVPPANLEAAGLTAEQVDESLRRALEIFGPMRAAVS